MRVRYYSHLGTTTGYGRAAAELALALAGRPDQVELELVQIHPAPLEGRLAPLTPLLRRATGTSFDDGDLPLASPPDITIIHTLPRDCIQVARRERLTEPVVAYTTWEAITMAPDVKALLEPFQQVWFPSQWSSLGFRSREVFPDKYARVLPHAYDPILPRPERRLTRDGRYRFYWIGTWGSPRKNIEGLIRAYCHAFRPTDDVELVLRTPFQQAEYLTMLAATGIEQHDLPLIHVIDKPMTDQGILQLHADCDCYVTASHGEGWDLPAFDAMLARRHIITTASGSQEFLEGTSAMVMPFGAAAPAQMGVRAREVRGPGGDVTGYAMVVTGPTGLTAREVWVEPNLVELAGYMRAAYSSTRNDLTVPAGHEDRFTHAAVAACAITLIQEILRV